ncbi:hypothetical protein LDENG_00160870 [Lucifuga dentata]|nr:hypothetical protein LDENG_00160870 [Lucifuga dentata]
MQLGGAHKEASSKSKLFQSLQVYLENKNRLQPIIGLGCITECVKAGTQSREVLYVCEVCACRLSKADTRNHIMGSLHRYNYIKVKHPHFVAEWKENANLSKLAWPLMEMAQILERREGPGDVQVLECEETLFDKMASQSETAGQWPIPQAFTSFYKEQSEQCTSQSQRIVVHAQKQRRQSQKPITQTINPASRLGDTLTSPEPAVLSENLRNFLDGYTGTKPLIGLHYVVECRNEEDGRPYCFLCHCCRIRTNKQDLIDHLTGSSHQFNYMMEVHPEQVEAMMEDINVNSQLLLAVANKVEQEEGRGGIKVIYVPASLCILLTGKSYHWCIKMLSSDSGWTDTNIQKRKKAAKGPRGNSGQTQQKSDVLPKRAKMRTTKRKMRKVYPVFKVSLPLTKGLMLLERTSFSVDNLPASFTCSSSSDTDLTPSPDFLIAESELNYDSVVINHPEHTSICTTSQFHPDFFGEDAETEEDVGAEFNLTCTLYGEVDDGFSGSHYVDQSKEITGTTPCQQIIFDNGLQINEAENRAAHGEAGYTQQWYGSTFQSEVGLRVEVQREEGQKEKGSDAAQMLQYYYQQPQQQYTMQEYTSLPTASAAHHGFTGGFALHGLTGDSHAHSGGGGAERMEQRGLQTCSVLPPQSYMTYPMVCQAIPGGHGVILNSNIMDSGQALNNTFFSQTAVSVGSMSHSNVFISSGPAQGYGISSDLNSGGSSSGFLGVVMSGNVDCRPTSMLPCPSTSVNSGYITAPEWGHISAQSTCVPVGSSLTQNVQHLF